MSTPEDRRRQRAAHRPRLAATIRTVREQRGLTQQQLAQALGVTPGQVRRWETGRSEPGIRRDGRPSILHIAQALDVPIDTFTAS